MVCMSRSKPGYEQSEDRLPSIKGKVNQFEKLHIVDICENSEKVLCVASSKEV